MYADVQIGQNDQIWMINDGFLRMVKHVLLSS